MTKLQLLHRALNERLMAAVEQIMEMVGGTVLEYEEETVRARKENEILRRRLRWMEGENPTDWPGEAEPSGLEQQPVSLAGSPALEPLAIKTEPIDTCDSQSFTPDSGLVVPSHTTDLEVVDPATSTPADTSLPDGALWDSTHSYMAPLDFDPTLPTMVRRWRGRGRSQRMSFACPDCGKVFGREHRLIIHMRIHSAERPYAYRRRKACFYGDKKRKKKQHRNSKTSREILDELSDASEQTERSAGLDDVSTSTTPAPSAPEVELDEAVGGASVETEGSASRPVGLRARQGAARAKMPRCLQCKRVFTHVSRLAIHMKTHSKRLPSQEEHEEQGDIDKTDRKLRHNPKKPVMRNNDTEVERARAGGQTLFQCSECKKVFARSCWLTFHLKSHERERSLARKELKQRQVPGSRTQKSISQGSPELTKETTKEAIAEHSKVHVLKKIFACPYCDKVFAREGWLGPHIRSHTSKMPQKSGILPDNIMLDSAQRRTRRTVTVQSLQQLKEGTNEVKKITEESKRKNEKSEKVTEQPKARSAESNRTDSESKRNSETKRISNESERTNDEANKISDESKRIPKESSGETDVIRRSKKSYPCRECGKVYLLAGWLKTHKKMHRRERMLEEKRRRFRMMEEQRRQEQSTEVQKSSVDPNTAENKPKRSRRVLDIEHGLDNKRRTKKQHIDESPPENEDEPSEDQSTKAKSKEAANATPGRCICKHCGKVYARRNWLNLHILGHRKKMLALQQDSDERQKNNDEQTSQGAPSTEDSAVQKGKDGGKASFPCPFCEKAFPRAMRLMVHMQIHSGEKPYPYRQRKEQFYGDPTRPRGPISDSQEPAIESTDEREKDEGIAVTRNQTSAVSQDHTSTTEPMETVQPQSVCTGKKISQLPLPSAGAATSHSTNHSRTDPKSVSNAISHFSLQPRIVLEPITPEPKHWTASGEDDFSAVSAGISDVELHQISDMANAATANAIDYQVNPPQIPLENSYSCHDSQNPLSDISYTVLSETDDPDIVCVKLGSFCKSRENTSYPLAVEKGDVELVETEVEPEPSGTQINSLNVKSSFTGTVNSVAKNVSPFSESEKGSIDRALISDSCSTDIILTGPEFLSSEFSSRAMHQEADMDPVYMIVSDVDEDNDDHDDDLSNMSNNLHENKERKTSTGGQMQIGQSGLKTMTISQSFQNPSSIEKVNRPLCNDLPNPSLAKIASEVLATAGAVDKTSVSSSKKVTESDSDVVLIPNETGEQSDHDGLHTNKDKSVVASESCTDPKGWFTCVPCGLQFDGEASLALHSKVHSLPGHPENKSSTFKKLKKKFKNNEIKLKQQLGHIKTSEMGRDDSTNNPEISGECDHATLVKGSADESSEGCPDTEANRSPRAASKALAVSKELKKEKKTLYCRFCGKACRKIELHLKYDHSREPEVMEALRFSKTPEERKKLLSHLCSKKKVECDDADGVRSDKAEDLVHCIFCKGSYLRNQFWKHALICEEKTAKKLTVPEDDSSVQQPKPILTQNTFNPESEKPIQDTICNKAQQTFLESVNALLPETDLSTIQNSFTSVSPVPETATAALGPETEDPPILYIDDSTVKMRIEASDPPILDSFHSAYVKGSIPDTGSSIAKNLNVEQLSPPILDSCHTAQGICHLELENLLALNMGNGQEQKTPNSECSDPPVLESCHSTQHEILDGESMCPVISAGGILDMKEQSTAELMTLPQFDVAFGNVEDPLILKSPSLLELGDCYMQHNIGQDCQNLSSQKDCVGECDSPPESVAHPDIGSSISTANKKTDRAAVPTTDGGDLQQTFDSEADAERTAMPNLECIDSQLIPDQESEMIARPDPEKGQLDSEITNCLVPDHVSYEIGVSSIQVFETSEHMVSAIETVSPPLLDHIPKETQQTPGPETDRTYSPTKQMFDSEGHVGSNTDELHELASQDCDFKRALDSDSTTVVKRKWDNQSRVVKEEPKKGRLSNPLQKTSEECVASTSTAQTSELESVPQESNLSSTSLEDSEGKAKLYKTHYCFYCKKPCVRITQHLQSMHPNEQEVAKALSYEKNSKERKQLLELLRSKGDFLHNTDVVRSGEGSLVPSRRLATATSNEDYMHCIYCLGLFSKRSVANHIQRCKQKYPDRAATSCSELLPVTVSRSPSPMSNMGCTGETLKTGPESIRSPLLDTSLSEQLKANPQSADSSNAGSSCTAGDQENPCAKSDRSLEGDKSVGHSGAQLDTSTERAHSTLEDLGTNTEHTDLETGSDITPDTSLITGETESDCAHKASPCDQTQTNLGENKKTAELSRVERRRRSSRPHVQPGRVDDETDDESVSHSTKVHVCEHCSATFCSPYHLRRHVYTHTGERPYWCSQCNMGFIQKYRFRNHRMTHHGETQLSLDQELARSRKKRSHSGEKPAHNELCQPPLEDFPAASPETSNPDVERATSANRDTDEP